MIIICLNLKNHYRIYLNLIKQKYCISLDKDILILFQLLMLNIKKCTFYEICVLKKIKIKKLK